MPRQGRIFVAGGIYHVIQRGLERRLIFIDDVDRKEFIRRLSEGLKETQHKCYGWVIMPNHFHIIIRSGVRPISDLMRKLLTGYALYFNKRHNRNGYLYQGRYKSILCQEDSYLLELVRYVHLNPLRGKVVANMGELSNYNWSGHYGYMQNKYEQFQDTSEILGYFGDIKEDAVKKYEEFVAEGVGMPRRDDLTGGGLIRSAGGWKEVMQMMSSGEKWMSDERILGDGDFVNNVLEKADEELERRDKLKRDGWDLSRLTCRVCDLFGIDKNDIKNISRHSKLADARSLLAYWGYSELGTTGVELANFFGVTKSSISSSIKRGRKIADENEYRIF